MAVRPHPGPSLRSNLHQTYATHNHAVLRHAVVVAPDGLLTDARLRMRSAIVLFILFGQSGADGANREPRLTDGAKAGLVRTPLQRAHVFLRGNKSTARPPATFQASKKEGRHRFQDERIQNCSAGDMSGNVHS
jgi:hypothetical protein